MLSNLSDILGYSVQATDKTTGTVEDIYIDDVLWAVRHVAVADSGGLGTQMAELDPDSLGELDSKARRLNVNKTHDEIANGPDVSSDLPVSKQGQHHTDPHLRSIRELKGYKVVSDNGPVGVIDGFIANDDSWKIQFVVVAADETADNQTVLVGPGMVDRVNFETKTVHLELTRDHFAKSPVYDPKHPIQNIEDVELPGRVSM